MAITWRRQRFRVRWRRLSQQGTPGQPAIAEDVGALIRQMWQANPTWGAPRIVGELRKLGIDVAKSTVEKYRVRQRKPPSPTWKALLKNHVRDLVALPTTLPITITGEPICLWRWVVQYLAPSILQTRDGCLLFQKSAGSITITSGWRPNRMCSEPVDPSVL
jgi:hypothetical protein